METKTVVTPNQDNTMNLPSPRDKAGAARVVPMSFAQQRLWTLDRLLPLGSVYTLLQVVRLKGALDVEALRCALNELVRRHEVLRTRFTMHDGEPMQVIEPELTLPLDLEDLSVLPAVEREAEAQRQIQGDARTTFDLENGPLLRVRLLRVAKDENLMLRTMHHLVTDGWSMGVLWRELSALYGAFVRGEPSPLPKLAMQYADYAAWQRALMRGEILQQQLAYWKRTLVDPPVLELPTDRPRPAIASYRGGRLTFEIGAELTRSLRALSRQEGATLFTTLLASLQVLLHRYTGQDDLAVGVPVAGRRRADIENLIGFFVNTLVIRGDLSGAPSFREYLGLVRARVLEAYAHQDVPFEKLVEELHVTRDLSRNPLFQVCFTKLFPESQELRLAGLETARATAVGNNTAKFDLGFALVEMDGEIDVAVEYATDLFDAATIERLVGHWRVLLEGIVADPGCHIGKLPLLAEAERRQLLVQWNDTAAEYPRDQCLHQLFEQQVTKTPHAVAVVYDDAQLTYAELNARANQLAHYLITLGVGPEVLAGLCLERSLELIVSLLGILKAGGAFVPLDLAYPVKRLEFMVKDTQAPVLVTQQGLLGQLPPYEGHILCLDRECKTIAAQPDSNPPCHATAENLAYLIYTSGSTGRPKGVMMPHRPVCNLTWWQMRTSAMPVGARTLQLAPAGFDVSVQEIFSTLCAGGTLVLISDRVRRDPTELLETIENASIARLFLTFTALQQLAETAVVRRRAPWNLGEVITAGEQLRITPAIARWLDILPNCRLRNQYGPTETHVVVTYSALKGPSKSWPALPPIGRPIPNTRIYVLDDHLLAVPAGATGELYIGGDGLARGYWNLPELTAERFVLDPFARDAHARMYRTGDRARYLPDGNIEFLGRLDTQVKLRGFRIELGEIEAVLAQQPQVREAVVQLREDTPGEPRLVAYVVTQSEAISAADLRASLKQCLPDYMLPAAFVFMAVLPLTPNGKVDRKALPAPDAAAYSNRAYEAPVGEIETTLAQIWADVLKLERVGRHDNFFELGGHSLLALRVVSRIRRQHDLEIPLRAIFEHPTIETLAILLLEKQIEADGVEETERRLIELEALTEETAANQLLREENESKASYSNTIDASKSAFHCPDSKSAWFGRRRCNLLILINEDFERESFERVARRAREFDPLINAVVLRDEAGTKPNLPACPTLIFSPAVVRQALAACGKTFCGYPLSKSEEYSAMEVAGICVPKWVLLCEGVAPDLAGFDSYVVQKPDYGGKGAEVKVVRKGRVRWKPITTEAAGTSSSIIIQELIHTGPQPVSYRVNTLFGKVLYSTRTESSNQRNLAQGGGSIVASARGSRVRLNFDDEIIRFGEAAAGALPDIPLLGFDIIREVPSGKLYVLEANAIGYVWNFHSSQVADYGFSFEEQFDGVRKAAYILAEKTQQHAC